VIHRLTVHPEHQELGHASTLMLFAESKARDLGCRSIRLDAFTKNPGACALYSGRGYRNLGTVDFRMGVFYCFEKVL